MSAFGELFKLIIYIFLCIPPFIIILLAFLNGKRFLKKGLILLLVSIIPITIVSYNDYSKYKKEKLRYVGSYSLTEYTNCEFCILKLNEDSSYSVSSSTNNIIESGNWKYSRIGDYWIVSIGKEGQLGVRNYKYYSFNKE